MTAATKRTLGAWPTAFEDRSSGGAALAALLGHYRAAHPVVLAIPNGGVRVGAEIASALGVPLDVLAVRRVPCPGRPSLALGAVAPGSVLLVDEGLLDDGLPRRFVERAAAGERLEVDRRMRLFRGACRPLDVEGRLVILVDDGAATGWTARAAVAWLRAHGAHRVVVTMPGASTEAAERIEEDADELVLAQAPDDRPSVALWYERFDDVADADVLRILAVDHLARSEARAAPTTDPLPRSSPFPAPGGVR